MPSRARPSPARSPPSIRWSTPPRRNFQVEATVANPERRLLPGMFAQRRGAVGAKQRYLTLPQTAITYNPYGATVFLVEQGREDGKR